jgi:hypothetical protein
MLSIKHIVLISEFLVHSVKPNIKSRILFGLNHLLDLHFYMNNILLYVSKFCSGLL